MIDNTRRLFSLAELLGACKSLYIKEVNFYPAKNIQKPCMECQSNREFVLCFCEVCCLSIIGNNSTYRLSQQLSWATKSSWMSHLHRREVSRGSGVGRMWGVWLSSTLSNLAMGKARLYHVDPLRVLEED